MSTNEVLAVARLRQWACDRSALTNGRALVVASPGRPGRNNNLNRFDAALVRVIDFDKALGTLDQDERAALVLRYRDRESEGRIATALRCSVRKVGYLLPIARRHLAAELERRNLL
jgi:DNA-directed RNA polymerase specialized sigma24 family protein